MLALAKRRMQTRRKGHSLMFNDIVTTVLFIADLVIIAEVIRIISKGKR